jgi:hypothetical protein
MEEKGKGMKEEWEQIEDRCKIKGRIREALEMCRMRDG